MVVQADYPLKWNCDSNDKEVRVEVRVRDEESRDLTDEPIWTNTELDFEPDVLKLTSDDAIATMTVSPLESSDDTVILRADNQLESVRIKAYPSQDAEGSTEPLKELTLADVSSTEELDDGRIEYRFEDGMNGLRSENKIFFRVTNGAVYSEGDDGIYSWIDIPTSKVEMWVEKGRAAQIQRTAKVTFPTVWGEDTSRLRTNSPRELIEQYDPSGSNPFMFGRVKYKDQNDNWVQTHFGWIGGVGGGSGINESKMWIYDFAEFITGVPVSLEFHNPSVKSVVKTIGETVRNETGTPLSGITVRNPDTEEELSELAEGAAEEGNITGISGSTVFDETAVATQYYTSSGQRFEQLEGVEDIDRDKIAFNIDASSFETATIDTKEGKALAFDPDTQHFRSNRHTLKDVFTWFEKKTEAKLSFEPMNNSVRLLADIKPTRRTFAQFRVITDQALNEGNHIDFHEPITVIKNDALYEMRPVNTLRLSGSYPKGTLDKINNGIQEGFASLSDKYPAPTETYPFVKVQVPSLVEAAGGNEISGEIVESDAKELDEAEREARQRLTQKLSEATEGSVTIKGEPRIMPFDKLVAYETCGDVVAYESEPVEYEVESVKHVASADEGFKTDLKVSIYANESNIETVERYIEEA